MRSKAQEIIEKLESIYEMANLSQKDHKLGIDLKIHIEQPGDKVPSHFARVKVFRGNYDTTKDIFTVSLPDQAVRGGNIKWLSSKEYKRVMSFIENNTDNFIAMFKDVGLAISDLTWEPPTK